MPRLPRIVLPGVPHHVSQRGNRQCRVFLSYTDREHYLHLLAKAIAKYRIDIWAWCLMTNHVHFVMVPSTPTALSSALHDTHTAYALWFNARHNLVGHLWQCRFFSCPMDDAHSMAAVRYVERNPVRAGLTGKAEWYQWSSASSHCTNLPDPLLSPVPMLTREISNWSSWLAHEDPGMTDTIRSSTRTGRPCVLQGQTLPGLADLSVSPSVSDTPLDTPIPLTHPTFIPTQLQT